MIYRYSGGVPRLINIAGERSLLTAYVLGEKKITWRIASRAVKELSGRGRKPGNTKMDIYLPVICVSLFFLSVIFYMATGTSSESPVDEPSRTFQIKQNVNGTQFYNMPERNAVKAYSGVDALNHSVALWGEPPVTIEEFNRNEDIATIFRQSVKSKNLRVYAIEGKDLALLKKLNLPAIVALSNTDQPSFNVLQGFDDRGKVLLSGQNENQQTGLTPDEFAEIWGGKAYILWRDFIGGEKPIGAESDKSSVMALKMILKNAGFSAVELGSGYDASLRRLIYDFQIENGFPPSGDVGDLTKMMLFNMNPDFKIPRLNRTLSEQSS
jgi:general secretion pathway protein A